jgi:ATP-dependent Lon protease
MSFTAADDTMDVGVSHKYNTRSKKTASVIVVAHPDEQPQPSVAQKEVQQQEVQQLEVQQQDVQQQDEIIATESSSPSSDDEDYHEEDDEDDDEDDEDDEDEDEDDDEDVDVIDYNELLASIFPSTYMQLKLRKNADDADAGSTFNGRKRSASPLRVRRNSKMSKDNDHNEKPPTPQLFNIVLNISDRTNAAPEENAPEENALENIRSTPPVVQSPKNKERKQLKAIKKQKEANTEKFRQLLREKNVMNDVQYFMENLDVDQQEKYIAQIQELLQYSDTSKPYRLTLLEAPIPLAFKTCAYRRLASLRFMEPGGGEYHKIKNWIDTFMRIPFAIYKTLPITLHDGVDVCHDFMDKAKKVLDTAVYGLNDAKLQIMQMVGQWIVNPEAIGSAIAIKGPMGTGKTTLVKEGISKILGRDFAFIALGGATDSSFLEGHSYTYEGSSWGKIVDIIIKSKCMNPVIYFDELDKVSDTPKGEEIIGVLTHLTDTTQNSKFHDKYFAELEFDLSRCLFIFSYNDESKINPILRDRMYRIQTKGYDLAQKTNIAVNYLLPKIREQVCFAVTDITFPEETLHYIINNHTEKEDGVRSLKRCLEVIHTKLNLYRLMKPGTNLFEADLCVMDVVFPMNVTPEIVDKLIKVERDVGAWTNMYM